MSLMGINMDVRRTQGQRANYGKTTAPEVQAHVARSYQDLALGLVATQSFPAIVGTADMMLKSSAVTLVGYEKIGSGHCTAVVRGRIADVRLAVEQGADTAEKFGQLVSKLVIARPLPNLDAVLPIGSRLAQFHAERGYSRMSNLAVGLLETRGFPAMVGGADAMLKAADVKLVGYETIGDGLCTALVRGTVSNVAVAIEAGMYEAERIGELHAIMVIPRPLDDLEQSLPIASHYLEKPLQIPLQIKEVEKQVEAEVVELPAARQPQVEVLRLPEPELQELTQPQPEPEKREGQD
jgi:carbon dioxide concentrating mechanism protein CcmO